MQLLSLAPPVSHEFLLHTYKHRADATGLGSKHSILRELVDKYANKCACKWKEALFKLEQVLPLQRKKVCSRKQTEHRGLGLGKSLIHSV